MPTVEPIHRPWNAKKPHVKNNNKPGVGGGLPVNFYRHTRWLSVRKGVLQDEPLCRECMKIDVLTTATVVDHITRIKAGGALYDIDNLQPLCEVCHNKKRNAERYQDLTAGGV